MKGHIFSSLLQRKPKTAQEAIEWLREVLTKVKNGDPVTDKLANELNRAFSSVKYYLFGDDKHEPVQEDAYTIARIASRTKMVPLLIETLRTLPFENRKEAAVVFGSVARMHLADDSCPGADALLLESDRLLGFLIDGYGDSAIALMCGQMVRDASKEARVANAILSSPMFYRLFKHLDEENFEIASDAISTLRDLLTRHDQDEGGVVPRYLVAHYEDFVENFHRVVDTGNYVTKRQCLKLLGEILCNKHNKAFTDKYCNDERNLMKAMQKLRDEAKGIQFEAFHVFKVFVRSTNRSKTATALLVANKEKLIKYLSDFHCDKDGSDEVFYNDKQLVIKAIMDMEMPSSNGRLSRDQSRKQIHGAHASSASLASQGGDAAGPAPVQHHEDRSGTGGHASTAPAPMLMQQAQPGVGQPQGVVVGTPGMSREGSSTQLQQQVQGLKIEDEDTGAY